MKIRATIELEFDGDWHIFQDGYDALITAEGRYIDLPMTGRRGNEILHTLGQKQSVRISKVISFEGIHELQQRA